MKLGKIPSPSEIIGAVTAMPLLLIGAVAGYVAACLYAGWLYGQNLLGKLYEKLDKS